MCDIYNGSKAQIQSQSGHHVCQGQWFPGPRDGVSGAPRGSRASKGSQVRATASSQALGTSLGMVTGQGWASTLSPRWGSGSRAARGTRARPSPGWPGRAVGTGLGRGQAGTSASGVGPDQQGPWQAGQGCGRAGDGVPQPRWGKH